MSQIKTLMLVLIIVFGITGCASRRCCRCRCTCPCHQRVEAAPNTAKSTVSPNILSMDDPADGILQDVPVFESEPTPAAPPAQSLKEIRATDTSPPVVFAKSIKPSKSSLDSNNDVTYGHADDYSWLKGRLQRVHVPGVEWKIRYSPIDEDDQWGGSMVLATDIRLEGFEDGDAVHIDGEQLEERPSLYVSGPLYRIQDIRRQNPVSLDAR